MSVDIDMKNLTGAEFGSDAGNQSVDTNSYHDETGEYPVYKELLEPEVKTQVDEIPEKTEQNPQAENFRAFRDEVDRMKAERETEKRDFQQQIELLRANLANKQSQPPQPERKFLDGMNDNDVPNVAELRKEWEERESSYKARLEEMQVAQEHPDYAEVIEKFVLPLVKQKPHLAEGLRGANNKALFAYELGKMAQQMQERQTQQMPSNASSKPNENAQKMVENAKKPRTLAQAGGQGALSQADHFATMSDQEFLKFASRNLDSI